ncbi:MAG: Gmad2 immunoglobulin-like domain-containing protein [Chloroflexota bacterium]
MVRYYSLIRHCEERLLRRSNLLLLLVVFLFGCSSASSSPTPAPTAEATLTPQPSPTSAPTALPDYVNKIRNAQYQLGATDALRVVQLADGKFVQGAPGGTDYVSVFVTDFVASGDLNKDGINEYAALISENYGGTGVFVFLTVFSDVNGVATFQTSTMVDDRPELYALSIENGEIFLDATTHAAEDPFCCPTLRTNRHYRFVIDNQLEMTDYTTFTSDGKPRTITITTPSNNGETYSSVQFKGNVTIAPFENNLAYRIYDLAGVELSAGSINVTAPKLGGPGTFDSVVSLGTILSSSVVRVEIQDISAADGSLFAMDSVELVVK